MKPALIPIPSVKSQRPFAQLSMDFIMALPEIDEKDSILSVVDHGHTKGVILISCRQNGTGAEETATFVLDNVVHCFGMPDHIISDQGDNLPLVLFENFGSYSELKLPLPLHSTHSQTEPWNDITKKSKRISQYTALTTQQTG